jgi:hypothetical protein
MKAFFYAAALKSFNILQKEKLDSISQPHAKIGGVVLSLTSLVTPLGFPLS